MRSCLLSVVPWLGFLACSQSSAVVGEADPRPVLHTMPYELDALDVLFVVDDSGSMADEQDALVAAARDSLFPQLAALPGGLPDLHVGVVSTDLGNLDGPQLPGCRGRGDDGALQVPAGCAGLDGRFLSDVRAPDGTRQRNYQGTLDQAFSCLAALGTGGCGFEQPLAALDRALDPSNTVNAGFLRPEAMLLVVLVTDEDDCSVDDAAMFGDPAATLASPLGPRTSFRCFEFGVACAEPEDRAPGARTACHPREDSAYVAPVQRFVDRLSALKEDPDLVMVTGVFGTDAPIEVGHWLDTDQPSLLSQCAPAAGHEAYPAVRLGAFARAFPARFLLPSACEVGVAGGMARIAGAVADVMARGTCLLDEPRLPLACTARVRGPQGSRALPVCDRPGCVRVAPSPACTGTEHHLAAVIDPALVPPGTSLELDCLTGR